MTATLAHSKTVRLATADTTIFLDAEPAAPRLLRLEHLHSTAWENQTPEPLIDHLETDGLIKPVHWEFISGESTDNSRRVQFVYECRSPNLRLLWEWRVRAAHGPIEHDIRIENRSASEVWLPLQDSFRFDFKIAPQELLDQLWVEKGASSPSGQGTHRSVLTDGSIWTGSSSTYAHPREGEAREIVPYLLLERAGSKQAGWYVGIEFSGRTRLTLGRHNDSIAGEASLNSSEKTYRTRLVPGEIFETPVIFLGAFEGGPDGAGNVLRRWIRETLNNPVTIHNVSYPLLVSNSWGSGMSINGRDARRMISDASDLGLEMFHLDAGWFKGVGDWTPDQAKFPDGVASVSDYAHKLGLKFGLWIDWTQAGVGTGPGALHVNDEKTRDWLTVEPPIGWRPHGFKGITIDIGVPAARKWATGMLADLVTALKLDMLEHDGYLVAQGCERKDHPHASINLANAQRFTDEEFLWVEGENDTDVSYHATRGYYEVQASLRRRFPDLLLEICNDGGRMVDFGSAAHGDYFSITDAYDPLSNRRAFFDMSYVLPPAMLETYVEKWPTPQLDNFRYMLRSGMMGWFSLMQDTSAWTPEQHEAARAEFELYKHKLRPLIRDANLYHVSGRPDGVNWDGMEYFDPATGRGALFAFRGSAKENRSYKFRLTGLPEAHKYKVTFQDRSSPDYVASGEQLMGTGVIVRRPVPNSSEIVFLEDSVLR